MVLSRVINDTRAAGPVTDRAVVLATLSTLYALVLVQRQGQIFANAASSLLWHRHHPGAGAAGVRRGGGRVVVPWSCAVLRWMSPSSENTTILLLALIAATHRHRRALGRLGPVGGAAGRHAAQVAAPPAPWAWPQAAGQHSVCC